MVLATLATLGVVIGAVWWLSATDTDDRASDPAEETDPAEEMDPADEAERVTMLLPNGDRVEVLAPPQLPTEEVRATADVTTGEQPVLTVFVDPTSDDPAWPEGELAEGLEVELLDERWGGELLEVTGTEVPRTALVWRGQDHGALLSPVIGTAAELLDALTLEERPDGVIVQVDPDLIADPGGRFVGITIGEEAAVADADGNGPAAAERLAVTVAERTDASASRAGTDLGGQDLESRSVEGGELFEDKDGRLRLVGETAIVTNGFVWDRQPGDQQDRMREVMASIRATWEPAGD